MAVSAKAPRTSRSVFDPLRAGLEVEGMTPTLYRTSPAQPDRYPSLRHSPDFPPDLCKSRRLVISKPLLAALSMS